MPTKRDGKPVESTHQEINLIRSTERFFGKMRVIFWHGGGRVFCGVASHMQALRCAREAAPHRLTTQADFNSKCRA